MEAKEGAVPERKKGSLTIKEGVQQKETMK